MSATLKSLVIGLDAIERGPQRANCDCCDKRPGIRTIIVYGIETLVCGPCSGDDEQVEEEERAMGGRSVEQWMEDECGYHGSERK